MFAIEHETDWIEGECISISLKEEETFLGNHNEDFKWIAEKTLHYGGDTIDKTYYRITKNGIYIKFFRKEDEGIYGIHFVPHDNIILFEVYEKKNN